MDWDCVQATSMTMEAYEGATALPDCICGCGRIGGSFYDGLAKHCHDMAAYHELLAAERSAHGSTVPSCTS